MLILYKRVLTINNSSNSSNSSSSNNNNNNSSNNKDNSNNKNTIIHYVMAEGFYSESNINTFYNNHRKFIIGIPFTIKFVCDDIVEEFRETQLNHTITSVLLSLRMNYMLLQNKQIGMVIEYIYMYTLIVLIKQH